MAEREGFDWAAARARIAELGRALERGAGDSLDVERLLVERAERYRRLEEREVQGGEAMVVFVCGDTRYAAPLASIGEIRITAHVTSLPGVSPVIKGIVNVRGRLAAVHDLASLGPAARELPKPAWLLIGHGPTAACALLADDVDDICHLHRDEIRPVPLSLAQKGPGFVGATKAGIVILDPAGLLASSEFFFA